MFEVISFTCTWDVIVCKQCVLVIITIRRIVSSCIHLHRHHIGTCQLPACIESIDDAMLSWFWSSLTCHPLDNCNVVYTWCSSVCVVIMYPHMGKAVQTRIYHLRYPSCFQMIQRHRWIANSIGQFPTFLHNTYTVSITNSGCSYIWSLLFSVI